MQDDWNDEYYVIIFLVITEDYRGDVLCPKNKIPDNVKKVNELKNPVKKYNETCLNNLERFDFS
jgi:hypothetical protein